MKPTPTSQNPTNNTLNPNLRHAFFSLLCTKMYVTICLNHTFKQECRHTSMSCILSIATRGATVKSAKGVWGPLSWRVWLHCNMPIADSGVGDEHYRSRIGHLWCKVCLFCRVNQSTAHVFGLSYACLIPLAYSGQKWCPASSLFIQMLLKMHFCKHITYTVKINMLYVMPYY